MNDLKDLLLKGHTGDLTQCCNF